ncbi:MAG: OprO/OprP family phosphate-selective porin [Bacteroidetes bacterium]|nr:OprO/OprP family phosphate-selective porin [Bacteroidota bacterium]MCX7906665.1 OprO/OprP family phosphate-selective porin [Bacteroidota bacterium]MDW8137055.1 porin [Bacteroidota bacterium]
MKRGTIPASLLLIGLMGAMDTQAQPSGQDRPALSVGGMIRPVWLVQRVDDPFRDDMQVYHFFGRARLHAQGSYRGLHFYTELALAGREVEVPTSGGGTWGPNPVLLDFYFDLRPFELPFTVRIGQYRTPFGLEQLTEYRELPFVERSLPYLFFGLGRDYGATLYGKIGGLLDAALTVQSGTGRNLPERYIAMTLGTPLLAGRVGLNSGLPNGLNADEPYQTERKWHGAVYLNALYVKDSFVGHSTALQVRLKDKPLLLNSNWNTFLARRPLDRGTLQMVGLDGVLQYRAAEWTIRAEAEYTQGTYKNTYGELQAFGGRLQAVLSGEKLDLGLRYAFVQPDADFGRGLNTQVPQPIGDKRIGELTPMLAYRLLGSNAKLIIEVPVWFDMPVAIENNIGAYALHQQPDQITYIRTAGNRIERQTLYGLQATVQLRF